MKFIILSKRKIAIFVSVFLSVLIIAGIFFGTTLIPSVFKTKRELPIYSVKTSEKKVAISFDCAWGTEYTDKLLSVMKEKDVICTFFAVEFWTEKYPDYVKKITEHGHDMGTHSATHPYMSKLSVNTIEKELKTSTLAIEKITGKPVKLFRPPYGDYDNKVIKTASSLGLYTIQWDVDSLDWKNLSASEIEQRVVNRVKEGSIVLFHNNGLHTAEALPNIIDALKNNGFEFVKIYDLIYKDNYEILPDGTQTAKTAI